MKLMLFFTIGMMALLTNCNHKGNMREPNLPPTDTISTTYNVIADSISYGLVVKNRDSTKKWQKKWLSHLNRDQLVNRIFEAVYERELKAYD